MRRFKGCLIKGAVNTDVTKDRGFGTWQIKRKRNCPYDVPKALLIALGFPLDQWVMTDMFVDHGDVPASSNEPNDGTGLPTDDPQPMDTESAAIYISMIKDWTTDAMDAEHHSISRNGCPSTIATSPPSRWI